MSFENNEGNTGNYWRIREVSISFENQTAFISVFLYKDQAAFDAGKKHMHQETFGYTSDDDGVDRFNGSFDYATLNNAVNTVAATETKLLTESFFSGATQV